MIVTIDRQHTGAKLVVETDWLGKVVDYSFKISKYSGEPITIAMMLEQIQREANATVWSAERAQPKKD